MRHFRFHYKVFAFFSIVIALLFLLSGTIFFRVTISVLEENTSKNQQQTNQKIAEQIGALFNEMNRISIAVNTSEEIYKILTSVPTNYNGYYLDDNPRIANKIKEILYPILELKTFEAYVLVFTSSFDSAGYFGRYQVEQDKNYLRYRTNFTEMMKLPEYKFIIPMQEEKVFKNNNFFALFRALRDPYSVWGGVYVGVPREVLNQICTIYDGKEPIHTIVYDAVGTMLYSNVPSFSSVEYSQFWSNIQHSKNGRFTTNPGKMTGYTCAFTTLPELDWTVLQLDDTKQYAKPVQDMRRIIIISYSLALLLLLAILYIVVFNLTKPIRALTKRVSNANLKKPVVFNQNQPKNEIDILGLSFQNLLDNLAETNQNLVEAHSRELAAYFSSLQAQMNPHFLYNTLSVIGAYARKSDRPEVTQMCTDLSKMLRYSAEFTNENATLAMEMKNVSWYLHIMMRRYNGCLEHCIDIDQQILPVHVPKLIIQPIVENAFTHGLKLHPYPWKIRIQGTIQDGYWVVRVEDNGSGFNKEDIDKLNKDYNTAKNAEHLSTFLHTSGRGIGLVNTFMRLHYFYKGQEQIRYYNADHGGAIVEVGGPIHEEFEQI